VDQWRWLAGLVRISAGCRRMQGKRTSRTEMATRRIGGRHLRHPTERCWCSRFLLSSVHDQQFERSQQVPFGGRATGRRGRTTPFGEVTLIASDSVVAVVRPAGCRHLCVRAEGRNQRRFLSSLGYGSESWFGGGDDGRRISAKAPASERRLQAAIASHLRWARDASQEARRAATQPMRDGLRSEWERMADPDGRLTPEELATIVDLSGRPLPTDGSARVSPRQ
jgi:hypothetical protein